MNKLSRRSFVRSGVAVAGSLAFPRFSIAASAHKGDKIRCAVVGVGGIGRNAIATARYEKIVAFCDVDDIRSEQSYQAYPDVPRFKDFRVMLDQMHKTIDVVLVCTPDHTHFPIALASMQLGINVFVQKPLTHNIWENRTLLKAAEYYKVKSVMGNQGHCTEGIRLIKEWYDAGLIGEVRDIRAWTDRPRDSWAPENVNRLPHPPVPKTLDWDLWLGPRSTRKYSPVYAPIKWRGWWDFGNGGMGDIGCHLLDAPFWSLNLGVPDRVELEQGSHDPVLVPKGTVVKFTFNAKQGRPKRTVRWQESGRIPDVDMPKGFRETVTENGIFIIGSKQTIYHQGIRPDSPQLLMTGKEWKDFRSSGALPTKTLPRVKGGPIDELFNHIKGGPEPGSSFSYAVPLTEMILLGALTQRTGNTINWDAKNMKAKGLSELDAIIKEPVRGGWSFGENLWPG